jgi:DNA-directed RNA polymerase subunit L/DNA-directed RNA polymerase alpha subunit
MASKIVKIQETVQQTEAKPTEAKPTEVEPTVVAPTVVPTIVKKAETVPKSKKPLTKNLQTNAKTPVISKIQEANNILTFTLSNVNVSIANGLRRIAAEIPAVIFRTSPHERNNAIFEINTTRMNNELLKQRLSCIPIFTDIDFPVKDYLLVVDKQNKTNTVEYVTTEDFTVVDLKTNQVDKLLTAKLFPPNPLTGDYPELVRLLPRVSENIEGERIVLKCKFDLGTAKEDSAFNVSSTCVYSNTPDPVKIKAAWAEKKTELAKTLNSAEIAFIEKDWHLLDAKREFLPDSFDFMVETVGPLTNMSIVTKAANLMLDKLKRLQDTIQSDPNLVAISETTIPNSFDITLKGEDYTLGKVIEYVLYDMHYDSTLNYCGFRKPHPHIDESLIRLGFKNPTDKVTVITYIVNAAQEALHIYDKISKVFDVVE